MSILPIRVRGKHRATPADLRAEITRLNTENEALVCAVRKAANEVDEKTRELNTAVVVAVGRLQKITELEGHLKAQAGKVVRRDAEVKRLVASLKNTQRALAEAQPRITVTAQRLDRPYVSHVQIPYPVPVGRSTSNDRTQEMAVLDWPTPVPA